VRTPSIDQTLTAQIPAVTDTGQIAACREAASPLAACPYSHHARAWHRAADVALVLSWAWLVTGAYVLARVWLALAGH
jgi:hypothetical protein